MDLARLEVVNLAENPLNTESVNVHIPQLEERGVSIFR